MKSRIVILPGDGVGPEVTAAARRVLEEIGDRFDCAFEFREYLIGNAARDKYGVSLTEVTLAACRDADAVLLGAVGSVTEDDSVPSDDVVRALRRGLGVFVNLLPVCVHPAVVDVSPLRPERLRGVDLLLVHDVTGGFAGRQSRRCEMRQGHECVIDTLECCDYEVERVLHWAFRLALQRRGKVTLVDRANMWEVSRLWRQMAMALGKRYADRGIRWEYMLAETAAMRLITTPEAFDVIVTDGWLGEVLAEEVAALIGSRGGLPLASLGDGGPGVYVPLHGPQADIAGQDQANPIGAIRCVALLLRHSLFNAAAATAVEAAINSALEAGCRPHDWGGTLSTRQMTAEIIARLH